LAYFRVEGTSRVSWSLLIEAGSEDEALDIARRTADSQSELRREHALRGVRHQVGHALSLTQPRDRSNGRQSLGSPERGPADAEQGNN
jgi:hypothetical protein